MDSFDPMALRRDRAGRQLDLDVGSMDIGMDIDSTNVNCTNVDSMSVDSTTVNTMDVDNNDLSMEMEVDGGQIGVSNFSHQNEGHYSAPMAATLAPQRQLTLQSRGALAVTSQIRVSVPDSGKKKRCAVCVKAMCEKRWDCPGTGNREWCSCPHPRIGPTEKVRIPEHKIIAFLEARARE